MHEKLCNCRNPPNRKTIYFDLTFEEFKNIITQPCTYCGIAYSMERKDMVGNKISTDTVVKYNGIDRIESDIGYTVDNSVPCCTHCNLAKRMLSQDEFLNWAKRVYEYNFLKYPPTVPTELPYKTKFH